MTLPLISQFSMTLTTVGLGVISMYTGFLWAWEYPDRVDFQVTSKATMMDMSTTENPWMSPRTSTHLNDKKKGFHKAIQTSKSDIKSKNAHFANAARDGVSDDPWSQPP